VVKDKGPDTRVDLAPFAQSALQKLAHAVSAISVKVQLHLRSSQQPPELSLAKCQNEVAVTLKTQMTF
jgi:hypothetical protein